LIPKAWRLCKTLEEARASAKRFKDKGASDEPKTAPTEQQGAAAATAIAAAASTSSNLSSASANGNKLAKETTGTLSRPNRSKKVSRHFHSVASFVLSIVIILLDRIAMMMSCV